MNTTYTHTKYTDKAKSTKENIANKKRKRRAPAARNLQARVALLSPLDARDKLTLIETFRLDFFGRRRQKHRRRCRQKEEYAHSFLYEETLHLEFFFFFFVSTPTKRQVKKKEKKLIMSLDFKQKRDVAL